MHVLGCARTSRRSAHLNARSWQAYAALESRFPAKGALRADLFRLVVMQRIGGVYADADTVPRYERPTELVIPP